MAPACCAPSTPWTAASRSAPTDPCSPANSSDGGSDDERKQPVRAGRRQPHQPVRAPRVEAPHQGGRSGMEESGRHRLR
ncbi:hypothetical protein CE169_10470, partial [Bifidobacterium longum]